MGLAFPSYLSKTSASRYALRASKAISAMSPAKNNQLKKGNHEKKRWNTSIAVNNNAACHAWKLHNCQQCNIMVE